MKTLSVILLSLFIGIFFTTDTNAQTEIKFAKGRYSKTMKVTVPANSSKKFVLYVNRRQVINVDVSGDIYRSNSTTKNPMYAVSADLINGTDDDAWQDGEGYLSILTGRKGKYVFEVLNSDRKAHTFWMKVAVTNDEEDYHGNL